MTIVIPKAIEHGDFHLDSSDSKSNWKAEPIETCPFWLDLQGENRGFVGLAMVFFGGVGL